MFPFSPFLLCACVYEKRTIYVECGGYNYYLSVVASVGRIRISIIEEVYAIQKSVQNLLEVGEQHKRRNVEFRVVFDVNAFSGKNKSEGGKHSPMN